ncbi:cytochrome c3 family protein [Thiocapsa roseopersicina]|uniref:Cytochrome c7 n=1 Tax=Thiocapsa roseopersicina TaxID=1058 RepID=A0A1H2SLF7_THIRO|nr:cytochrome c3 family protein [Thiocapsa roseopersicina]SDW32430.1 Cytochrome c7 [Thiocapsa roseopersicina]
MNPARNRVAASAIGIRLDHPDPTDRDRLASSTGGTRCGRLLLAVWLCVIVLGTPAAHAEAAAADPGRAGEEVEHSEAASDRHGCLRCHAMPTLAYRNPESGEIVDLSIDREGLAHSVHGELACIDCHRRSYRRYPHPDRPAPGDLDCIGCHEDDDQNLSRGWVDIDAEFKRSVHAVSDSPKAVGFSCHSCHDPHRFRPAAVGEPIAQIVRNHNEVCLSCHGKLIAPTNTSHDWLPNRDAHWASVRCVECHTPVADFANHEVLPAEKSEKNCVSCHSANPQLLARLYHFQSEEDIARSGLLAKAVFNEAYVVGMSKSPALDRLSLAIMGLMVLLLAAHGVGRYLVRRANRRG